jgi:hypothetical protein
MSEGDAEVIGPRSCRCLLFAIRRTQHCLGCDGCRYCRATMAVASGRVNSIWNLDGISIGCAMRPCDSSARKFRVGRLVEVALFIEILFSSQDGLGQRLRAGHHSGSHVQP